MNGIGKLIDFGFGKAEPVPPPAQVDLDALRKLATDTASQNIQNSIALEKQYTPEIAASRGVYGQNILQALKELTSQQAQQQGAADSALAAVQGSTPQVQSATLNTSPIQDRVNALVMENLKNPGALPPDVYDYVVRQALSGAGGSGLLGGPGAGNLTLRQLGLSSLDQYNRTLATGNQVGQQQSALNQSQQAIANQLATVNANMELAARGQKAQTGLEYAARTLPGQNAMQAIFNTPYPVSGLSPESVANASVGNTNAQTASAFLNAQAANAARNANMQFVGQLAGGAFGAIA